MAVRPGGRRYNSEVRILTHLERLNPAKKGLRSLSDLMRGLVLSGGKMETFTENLNKQVARSSVESNSYLTKIKDINTQYDALHGLITSLGTTDPINVDQEQFKVYQDMMGQVADMRLAIRSMSNDEKERLGITEDHEKGLSRMSNMYLMLQGEIGEISNLHTDLYNIQEDIAEVAKTFEPLYNAATQEIGLMGDALVNSNDSSKEFFAMAKRSFGALSGFFKPLTDGLKKAATEMAKDKLSKYIYGKLVPSGQAMTSTMTQGAKASGGLGNALKSLIPGLTGTGAAATGTATGMATAGTAATGTSSAMAGTTAAAGGLTAALGPLAIVVAVVAAAILVVVGTLAAFVKGLQMNIKTMERYRETSFRAAGSIRELTNATYDLTTATGLSNAEAAAVITSLSQAGFAFSSLGESVSTTTGEIITGQAAMARLAKTNAMFTKATGASTQATAALQKSLTAMGVAIDKQEALFGQLIGSAAKYGITGDDLNGIIGSLRGQAILLTKVLDDTDFNEYAAGYTTMAGAARSLGIELGTVNKLMQEIAKGEGAATTLAALGGNLAAYFDNDAANNLVATAEGAERVLKMAENMQGIVRTQFLASFGGEEELVLLQKTAEMRRSMTAADIQAEKDLAAQREQTQQQYNQSLQTITQQMQRLFAPILAAIAKVVGPMVDGLIKFFEGTDFGTFANVITSVMNGVGEVFGPMLTMMGEFFSLIMELFDTIWTLIEPLVPVFKLLGGLIMSAFIIPIRLVVAALRVLNAAILKPLAIGLASIFKPLGTAAKWIMKHMQVPLMDVADLVKDIGAWWDKALKPMRQASGILGVIVDFFKAIGSAALAVWDALFGSSLFHIMESINEDTAPALKFLYGLFEILMVPINIVKDAVTSLFEMIAAIPDKLGGIIKKVGNLGKKVTGFVGGLGSGVMKAASSVTDIAKKGMGMFGGVGSWLGRKVGLSSDATEVVKADVATKIAAAPSQVPPAYTVQVEEQANNQSKLIAQLTETSDMSRHILTKLLDKANGDTPAGREAAESLRKLVESQQSNRDSYPDTSSGFGERTNMWYGS